MHQQELAPAALRRLHGAYPASTVEFIEPQAFEHADRRMDRRVGCAQVTPAVPAAIGHLPPQQVINKCLETVVVAGEVAEDGEHHPGDAGLAAAAPSVVDAAVALEPAVEEEPAGRLRLPVVGGQPEVAEQ